MILLSIEYNKEDRIIYDRLIDLCKIYKEKNINIAIAESSIEETHNIKCILRDTEKDINDFYQNSDMFYLCAADIIYDFITKHYEIEILKRMIEKNYNYMEDNEIEEITKRCTIILTGTGIVTSECYLYSVNRRNDIMKKIEDYFQENNEIILEGFIRFRLKDIEQEICEIIDKVIEEYIIEKEYSEFIKLLKYFVEIQDSKYEEVNIFISETGDYKIEDGNGNNIEDDFFDGFQMQAVKDEVNMHDILISALITNAPKKVIIHDIENSKSQDIIDTIKNIFQENVIFCSGCSKCSKYQSRPMASAVSMKNSNVNKYAPKPKD